MALTTRARMPFPGATEDANAQSRGVVSEEEQT